MIETHAPAHSAGVVSQTAIWFHGGLPPLPIRWVLIRDPKGKFKTQALLCTEVKQDPIQIINRTLRLEGRVPDGVSEALTRLGHDVQMMPDWSQTLGHAQANWIDEEAGVLHGGADPRGDGLALGE